jgi:hypothetical protein
MARYVGYSESEANGLASSVVYATDGVLKHEEAPRHTSLDMTIDTSDIEIKFRVHYKRDGTFGAVPVVGIERLLGRQRGNDVPIDIIRRVMERVEFGQHDGVEFCTLTMTPPEEV